MIATIRDAHNGHYEITSSNTIFRQEYGTILLDAPSLVKTMNELTFWANNEYGEEMLFEADD